MKNTDFEKATHSLADFKIKLDGIFAQYPKSDEKECLMELVNLLYLASIQDVKLMNLELMVAFEFNEHHREEIFREFRQTNKILRELPKKTDGSFRETELFNMLYSVLGEHFKWKDGEV